MAKPIPKTALCLCLLSWLIAFQMGLCLARAETPANQLKTETLEEPIVLTPVSFTPQHTQVASLLEFNPHLLESDLLLSSAMDTSSDFRFLKSNLNDSETLSQDYFKLHQNKTKLLTSEESDKATQSSAYHKIKHFLKGKPAQNQLMLGMWAYHIDTSRHYRDTNDLLGIQYKGIMAATFLNSYSKQTFVLAVARTVYQANWLNHKINYALGYKFGPMVGYTEGVPNIGGFTLLPMVVNSLNIYHFGVDFNLVPGKVISWNLHML